MLDAESRPWGRVFYWAMVFIAASGVGLAASGFGFPAFGLYAAFGEQPGGLATTTVADTVYMADGGFASGNLIITWPAFVTADGSAVAPGSTSVTLRGSGGLSVALVPNAGASPAGVYYSVTYQLGPGQVRTESWIVPATSPANLAAVRATPGSGVAAQPVSQQYVNSALATKADDSAVVHLSGVETIRGAKTFASSPSVPGPTNSGDIATKGYVDSSVANVGAGNYLSTAGGTMTGPIMLPGSPSAPLQAATKGYVDQGYATKADLIAGLIPRGELGTGTANAGTCLLGDGTWGACAGGGGTGNVSTAPAASQNVAQPKGTQFSTNNLANVRYVTAVWNWSQSPADSLATAGSNTIHLNPCPVGIDTSNNTKSPYYVYIAGTGTAEAALITGGTCASGAASGTIVVTTGATHGAGYTVGSSTSGIQEALNDAGSLGAGIVIPPTGANANALPVYSTIYVQSNKSSLRGEGKATLLCKTRSVCMFIGDRANVNDVTGVEVSGLRFAAGNSFDGIPVTNTACSANVATITLNNTGPNAVQAGDFVDVNWTFTNHYLGIHQVASASAAQFTYADPNCGGVGTIAAQATAGFASLENAAIEVNAMATSLREIQMSDKGSLGSWGVWQNQIVVDNDQAFKLDTLNIDAGPNCTANYCGQAIYFPGPFSTNAAVAWLNHLNLSLNCGGNGVTDWAGNTLRIQNSVIQGFRQWGVLDGTMRGGYGGGEFDDVYEEVGNCTNPMYPGTGAAQQSATGLLMSGNGNTIHGGEFPIGQIPQFAASGNQGTRYNYCFVVHDTSKGVSKCLTAGYALVDGASPSGNIVVSWPRVQGTGTVSYDLVRYSGGMLSVAAPYNGGCGGGSTTACGSVATAVAQCGTSLCSLTDTASASTSSYTVAAASYIPGIFWLPGGLVSVSSADTTTFLTNPTFLDDTAMVSVLSPITTEAGSQVPQIFSQRCSSANGNEWISCLGGNSNGNNAMPNATVLQYGYAAGGPAANVKGRLNFTSSPSGMINSGEIVTLVDSNPAKTLATPGNRPAADAADTFLGTDSGGTSYGNAGLAMGAPVSISSYINALPNGTSFLERLTAGAKTFNVPVTVNGNVAVTSGTVTLPITGSTQCLHVNSAGVVSGTGSDCGSGGGGGGSGTVNSGTGSQIAMYSANGTAVSGDSTLTDNGTTLSYAGAGGISASSGNLSGNLTLGGQLLLTGPWLVNSPIPQTSMASAGTGTSSLGISSDGNFYVSANGGAPSQIATTSSPTFSGSSTFMGPVSGTSASFTGNVTVGGQIIGTGPWAVSGPAVGVGITPAVGLSQAAFDATGILTVSENGGPATQVAKVNSNITGSAATAANLTGTPTLPNGTSAATQGAGDNSTKIATTAYVDGNSISPALDWGKGFTTGTGQTVGFNTTTNHANLFGIYIDHAVRCSGITVFVVTADNSANTYDIGFYSGVSGSANNLIAHTGAVAGSAYFATGSSYVTVPFGSTVTLMPGRYYLALYANEASAPLTLAGNTAADWEFYHLPSFSITPSAGGLPGTLTGPADGITSSATPHFLLK